MITNKKCASAWTAGICCAVLCMSSLSALTAFAADGSRVIRCDGAASSNISANNYRGNWYQPITSYLVENGDGSFTRVEAREAAQQVLVETFSADGKLLESILLDADMPLFGGFYSGRDANFLVFGDNNLTESNQTPVLTVVKYSKNWKKLGGAVRSGLNTYRMFDGGSLRMTETDGLLYIHTCHTMYANQGLNHQANCTFVVDEASMAMTQELYEVSNSAHGYISHSFNQFIEADGAYLYRADHGDAYPRGLILSQSTCDNIRTCISRNVLEVGSTYAEGGNSTGFTLGGFAVSATSVIAAVSTVDQDAAAWSASSQRNIELIVLDDKSQFETSAVTAVPLTDYTAADGISVRTPQLTEIGSDRYTVMWEESSAEGIRTMLTTVNGKGQPVQETLALNVRLSDCQPIVTADGCIAWYVTDGGAPTLYLFDVAGDAEGMLGDVNGNLEVDVVDAQLALIAYSERLVGQPDGFTKQQTFAADINADGDITVEDSQFILNYYAWNVLAEVPTAWDAVMNAAK